MPHPPLILAIESSCDDTGVAVIRGHEVLSNVIANQSVHENYGGVVPELASRAHAQNIVPALAEALKIAEVLPNELNAVAYTCGPGLMGSLHVGVAFAKSWAWANGIPSIPVNHMQAHVLAHFLGPNPDPGFPFLCLTVSGGHTQLVKVVSALDMSVIGETRDDAAGEAFDKVAKLMGLPYPGGPVLDRLARDGNPNKFRFSKPRVSGLDMSFSGLKTQIWQFLQHGQQEDSRFVEANQSDIAASVQASIIGILLEKLEGAVTQTGITEVAIAGGVSANSGLRKALFSNAERLGWKVHIPPFEFCTDNAAMVAMAGLKLFETGRSFPLDIEPMPRLKFN
ncbi:tRNA (adenosine(37)-N6)-threonylcarbamoyltransferase complex transferase subunit TsaD [Flavobacteriales bacterium]|nr:tRNA (adenosine(37)-N6)-threonylcarbamoyltransferase complex transferase subunit TsaD [Flavobacteriales bacterium]